MEAIELFYDYVFIFLIFIFVFVFGVLFLILLEFWYFVLYPEFLCDLEVRGFIGCLNSFSKNEILEFVWTVIPSIVLVFIAVPSFSVLYGMEEFSDSLINLKVVGHQWYWSYEYGYSQYYGDDILLTINEYDSNMLSFDDLSEGSYRLLEVDKCVVLPVEVSVRILVTSDDVIHSWAVPSFGVKIDAIPGRLNQVFVYLKHYGVFYGQCSELCGVNHGFMPIVVKVVSPKSFVDWFYDRLILNDW